MSKKKNEDQAAGNEPDPSENLHAGQHVAHNNIIDQSTLNDKVKASNPYGIADYVKAAYCKITGEPKPQGVRFDAKSPEFSPGGPFEALGYAVAQLKAGDSREAREQIFDGLVKEFYGDENGLIQLGSLRGLLDPWLPGEPCPDQPEQEAYPTLADLDETLKKTEYIWGPYIMKAGLNAIAGDVGAGKTVLAMDLHRRQWFDLAWPDDKPIEEPGKRAIWLMSDQRLGQLRDTANNMGVPLKSVVIAAEKDSPTVPLLFNEQAAMDRLRKMVKDIEPWAVIVDTFTSSMGSGEQSKPEVINPITMQLLDIAITYNVAIILLCHTNSEGRIYGKALERKTEHTMSLVLTDKADTSSPRNLHCRRSRQHEFTRSFGIVYDRKGYAYCDPYEEAKEGSGALPRGVKTDRDLAAVSLVLTSANKNGASLGEVSKALETDGRTADAAKKAAQRVLEKLREQGRAVNHEKQWYASGQQPPGVDVSTF